MLRIKWKTDEEWLWPLQWSNVTIHIKLQSISCRIRLALQSISMRPVVIHDGLMLICDSANRPYVILSDYLLVTSYKKMTKDGPIIPMDSSPDGNLLFIQCTNVLNTTNKKRAGKRKKPGQISQLVQVKYGVIIPCGVKHAMELDTENSNTLWADAIKKEIDSLLRLGCFDFCAPDFKPSSEYQFAKLTMIFEVKQDGRRKAKLVAGGHMVKLRGISQLPIYGSEGHQRPIAGFNCTS
jgi:hypothetical protein